MDATRTAATRLNAMRAGAGDPMALAEQRLRWIDRRQEVLAQNVAHADTPGYRPRDVTPFATLLAQGAGPSLSVTDTRHLLPASGTGAMRARAERRVAEVAPDGNAVALDEQALKIADNETAHQLASGLHRRYVAMFRTALGRNG
ncbi:flagellar biosynthesis protein FlgB [Roseomonas sp. OT10]|uniref:flagellar basal body rod protein FlgB n=1 Tax=Roseomonas cutis TaxID=2897332 RepID=UPI001E546FA7|nr:flagellar biosynthesis protein FlgB [Roseomonas sp. OT10]UFN48618.1 flagellar biosynthesis protein FlgB [Roseomonas sp. OT10]